MQGIHLPVPQPHDSQAQGPRAGPDLTAPYKSPAGSSTPEPDEAPGPDVQAPGRQPWQTLPCLGQEEGDVRACGAYVSARVSANVCAYMHSHTHIPRYFQKKSMEK